jgi:hypothetical protein
MTMIGLSGAPGAAEGLQKEVLEAPRETLRVLACCQALIQVDGDLVGDPLERAAFQAAGALKGARRNRAYKHVGNNRSVYVENQF